MISIGGELASDGWTGAELAEAPERWQMPIPGQVREDLLRIASTMPRDDIAARPFQPRPNISLSTRVLISDLHRRLTGEPGFAVLTGFPVEEESRLIEAAYWVLGLLVGMPVREELSKDLPLIVRVENVGRDDAVQGAQGNRQGIALPFHIDRCTDLVGLLCVRGSHSGGMSRLISSKRLSTVLHASHPDLHAELCRPFPFRVPPLRAPYEVPRWCEIPVFSQIGDDFAATYARHFVEQTQSLPQAPRLTERQISALDATDKALGIPGLPLDMYLRPGDVQFVNNMHVLHARTAYRDEPATPGRLLLRLHLAFAGSPTLPAGYMPMFGATLGGTYRGGVWRTTEHQHRFGTPLAAR